MDASAWVSAACAALSMGGAGFAWWWSNLSGKARREAEAAESDAKTRLDAVKEQVAELRRLADAMEGPPLVAEPGRGKTTWRLRNTSRTSITVDEVVNADKFLNLAGLDTPITLDPGEAREFSAFDAWGHPIPPTVTLRLASGAELHVPLTQ